MKKAFFYFIFIFFPLSLFADEGMWMLQLLTKQKIPEMKALGLKLEAYDIYNPDGSSLKDAVVFFGRGCTGEVVSSEGLVLTNHHCGYNYIQKHSSLEENYLEDGFWAMTRAEELPNPGLTVAFIDGIEDVTNFVKMSLKRDAVNDSLGVFYLSPKYLNALAREKVSEKFLSENPGTEVEIKPFFDGNQYFLFIKKIYSDIRLVGAPPSSIGKFGADTDNWMWPRHTGDFSIFRIYADKNGNPASYSPKNIPLRPKRWLKISTKGFQRNDFAMMLGFPGTTNKYYTSWEVAERRDIDNDVRIRMRDIRQKTMLEAMLADPKVNIQYASKYSGSTNGYKNAVGMNWAINMRQFDSVKYVQQEQVLDWASRQQKPEYAEALNAIKKIVEQRADLRFRSRMLYEGILRGIEFANVRYANANLLLEALQCNDEKAVTNYSLKLVEDYRAFADKNYNPEVDKKVSKALLKEYVQRVPRNRQPAVFEMLYTNFYGNVDTAVDYIFENSIFGSEENMQRFLKSDFKKQALQEDPMFMFAKSVKDEYRALWKALSVYDNPFDVARKKYVEGILEMDKDKPLWPDANLTLRLTYGQVKGYTPRDCVSYGYQTTIKGIMEKEDPNNWEFIVSDKLKQLYCEKKFGRYAMPDGNMPVAFTATTHSTGGNSGSPVLNAKGELIGINFDRNWEGVGGDIQYLPDYQRSIIVDIRYVLFVIDKFADAGHLLEEMELQ